VLAGSIVVLVLAAAIAVPNGHTCGDGDSVDVHRQWSFGQETWFYVCFPDRETIEEGASSTGMPMGATTDWRIPLRIGVVIAGLVLAWAVVNLNRRGLLGATSSAKEPWTTDRKTRILLAIYALFGVTIAVLVTLRQDEYWVRGTFGPSYATRSFLGWDMTPVLAEGLFAVVGAAGGIAVGLLVSNVHRRFGSSRVMASSPGHVGSPRAADP
jgi:hypothetical protein